MEYLVSKYNYWGYAILMLIGVYGMMGKRNLMKKLIGMNIFQTAIILFFVSTGVKKEGTLPIVREGVVGASYYMNPLPHAMMLTAIVVTVATTGVGLALLLLLYRRHKTLEEDDILKKLRWKRPRSNP